MERAACSVRQGGLDSSMPRPERDVVHGIDGDFAFGGEGTDFDEPGALFGFGPAFEFAMPRFVAAVPLGGADQSDGTCVLGAGGFRFHSECLVEGGWIGTEVAEEGARVADSDLDVGFEFDSGSAEGGFAFLTPRTEWKLQP